jgi:transposase
MPPGLQQALGPVLQQIAEMTLKIKEYDRQLQQLTQTEYPETQALLKVQGVGYITALTFVLTLGNKERFGRSRDVGCYLGLRPRRSLSGERDPQLSITKAGIVYLRSLLIESANHSSDLTEETRRFDNGDCIWQLEVVSKSRTRLLLR